MQTGSEYVVNPADAFHVITYLACRCAKNFVVGLAQYQNHYRWKTVRGSNLQHCRVVNFWRQFLISLILDLAAQIVYSFVEHGWADVLETHQDSRDAFAATRRDEAHVGDLANRIFERLGNQFFDVFRRGAAKRSGYIDPVEIYFWILLTWHLHVSANAHNQDDGKCQIREYVIAKK